MDSLYRSGPSRTVNGSGVSIVIPPNNVPLGFRRAGSTLLPQALTDLVHLGGGRTVAAFGLCDWERPAAMSPVLLPRLPAPDLTLVPSEVHRLREAHAVDQARMHDHVVREFVQKLLAAVPPGAPVSPVLLAILDVPDVEHVMPHLARLKTERLPGLSITLAIRWPEPGHENEGTGNAITAVSGLRRQQIIDVAYAFHPRSPLARQFGEFAQGALIARVLAALMVADRADEHNKGLPEVSRSIGTSVGTMVTAGGAVAASRDPVGGRGTFAAMAIEVASVAPGRPHRFSGPFRRALGDEVGYGDPADCVQVAIALATRVLHDARTRTIDVPFDPSLPPFELLFIVPFPYADPRFIWIAGQLRAWQTGEVPQAGTPLVVSGNGRIPALHPSGRYYCLVAALFGVEGNELPAAVPTAGSGTLGAGRHREGR